MVVGVGSVFYLFVIGFKGVEVGLISGKNGPSILCLEPNRKSGREKNSSRRSWSKKLGEGPKKVIKKSAPKH